jgi:abortive infection bacteriophage resistance protein
MLNYDGFFISHKMSTNYTKPPITHEQQLALLQKRGLSVSSVDTAITFLKQVNYYRFSAYCLPFQNPKDTFIVGTTFEKIKDLYTIDEELRNRVMKVLSPIEIFLRTRMVYQLCHKWGAFAQYNTDIFRDIYQHDLWVSKLDQEAIRGKENFLEHYKLTYQGFPHLPIWMATEIMSIGRLSFLYANLKAESQRDVCSILEVHHYVLRSWMHFITHLRNICAHHGRLWNREFAISPDIPRKDEKWHKLKLKNNQMFSSIVILEWICKKAELPAGNIETVYQTVQSISDMDPRFSNFMGVPSGRVIGKCWE